MRKIGAFTLCVALLIGALSVSMTASAADVMLQYATGGAGTAWITGYTGDPVALGIPDKAGDWTVNGIGDAAFEGCQTLERVVLPDSVESIGIRAFADCPLLSDITLPDGVRHVGTDAFVGTAYYNEPANWTDHALYLDGVLLTVEAEAGDRFVVADDTKTIAQRAFINLPDLKAVILPASLTYVDADALDGCDEAGLYMFADATYAIEYAQASGRTYGVIADLVKDGRVDMLDALILYNMISKGTLPADMQYTADYDVNGTVNMMDCLQLYADIPQ
ncbi:MAG: leucine-rich repeat protein [Clostridia bacterium]|nr:leucine-rich repeat protein [Clostridia bacterium]